MIQASREQIRTQLSREVRPPLTDKEWQWAIEKNWVQEIEDGCDDASIEGLADEIRSMRMVFDGTNAERQPPKALVQDFGNEGDELATHQRDDLASMPTLPQQRQPEPRMDVSLRSGEDARHGQLTTDSARSMLLAHEAAQERAVKAFRRRLPEGIFGVPLEWNMLRKGSEWIKTRQRATQALNMLEGRPYFDLAGMPGDSDGPWVTSIPPTDEDLQRLTQLRDEYSQFRELYVSLAQRYRWGQSDALYFLMYGIVPSIEPLVVHVDTRGPFPATDRIDITVDPKISPRELAEAYGREREKLIGKRSRDLTEKHLRLAVFPCSHPKIHTVEERMAAWNAEYPQWRYQDRRNFNRDHRQARARLLRLDAQNEKENNDG